MIKYGVDGSGQTYYANVYDDSGECVLSGDAWESPEAILTWYSQLQKAIGNPPQIERAGA